MKFVHCGVKMFVKQDAQRPNVCRWRIQTDGLRILEPWVGPRRAVVLTKKETLRKLLVEMFPKVADDGWKDLGEIGERVRDIEMGCSILYVRPEENFRYVKALSYSGRISLQSPSPPPPLHLQLRHDQNPIIPNSLRFHMSHLLSPAVPRCLVVHPSLSNQMTDLCPTVNTWCFLFGGRCIRSTSCFPRKSAVLCSYVYLTTSLSC